MQISETKGGIRMMLGRLVVWIIIYTIAAACCFSSAFYDMLPPAVTVLIVLFLAGTYTLMAMILMIERGWI